MDPAVACWVTRAAAKKGSKRTRIMWVEEVGRWDWMWALRLVMSEVQGRTMLVRHLTSPSFIRNASSHCPVSCDASSRRQHNPQVPAKRGNQERMVASCWTKKGVRPSRPRPIAGRPSHRRRGVTTRACHGDQEARGSSRIRELRQVAHLALHPHYDSKSFMLSVPVSALNPDPSLSICRQRRVDETRLP